MKFYSAALGLLALLVLAALWFEHHTISALQTELDVLARDRDSTNAELRKLNARMSELQSRATALASAASAQRTASDAERKSDAAAVPDAPAPRKGVTVAAPAGWHKNGARPEMYVVGVDSNETWGGMPSAYVQSLASNVENGFGGMMQTTAAENYVGKRVRLSGWIKTEDANQGGGHLWLRIDGQERGQMLGFDNMDNRPAKGTSDWQEASVVLDVPAGASALAYGFFVSGGGKMWVNGQKIEEVGPDVPTTNMMARKPQSLPAAPQNLGFDPNRPK